MKIIIQEKKLINWLIVITLSLAAFSVFFQISKYFWGHGRVYGLVNFFDLGHESNLPSFFSTILLLSAGIILFYIYKIIQREGRKNSPYWLGLAIIFIYLGIDESISIHENLSEPVRDWLDLTGPFYFGWIIIGILFCLIILIIYIKFLMSLTPIIRFWIIFSGFIYITGVLGMEMVGSWYYEIYDKDFLYQIILTVEEVLEMIGAIFFIKALLKYIKLVLERHSSTLKIEII